MKFKSNFSRLFKNVRCTPRGWVSRIFRTPTCRKGGVKNGLFTAYVPNLLNDLAASHKVL